MLDSPPDARWRSHAVVLAAGTFAVGTDAFVIAGLLPSIAGSLQVSIGQAGQLVTVFALAYAISAPLVGALAAGWPLRTAVLVALLVLGAGNALTALAPAYPVVLASRVVAGVGAALYTASAPTSGAEIA
jgi:DHA1 family inner membrane transport protein